MNKVPTLMSVALGLCTAVSFARADALGEGFARAQQLVRDFKANVRPDRPTWSPSFVPSNPPPPPPSPVEISIAKEKEKINHQIGKLTRTREAWRTALEALRADGNWRDELQYWTEESEAAQIGALTTSLGLLIGVAGPLQEAIAVHRQNAAQIWTRVRELRSRLGQVNLFLTAVEQRALSPEGMIAVTELRGAYEMMVAALRSEDALVDLFQHLDSFGNRLLNATKYVELITSISEKHNLMLAIGVLKDFVVRDVAKDLAKHYGTEALLRKAATGAAQGVRLTSFFIDYGYHSTRFYLAWANVNEILSNLEDRNALEQKMAQMIVESTDQIGALKAERRRLEQLKDKTAMENVLAQKRQKELTDARMAGEWFSQQTGFSAPGHPILNN